MSPREGRSFFSLSSWNGLAANCVFRFQTVWGLWLKLGLRQEQVCVCAPGGGSARLTAQGVDIRVWFCYLYSLSQAFFYTCYTQPLFPLTDIQIQKIKHLKRRNLQILIVSAGGWQVDYFIKAGVFMKCFYKPVPQTESWGAHSEPSVGTGLYIWAGQRCFISLSSSSWSKQQQQPVLAAPGL